MGIIILVSIIAAAGLLGGTANYYMEQSSGARFWKSVFLGLTAAATVPLFLKTVSSNLMADSLNGDVVSHFVFFGFCTIAAIFSSKFLQSLADKLLQEVKEVKEKQVELTETTDVLVAQNSEPAETASVAEGTDGTEFESFRGVAAPPVSPNTSGLSEAQRVLKALESGKFAFRTAEGIAKDAGLDLGTTQIKLMELEKQGKATKTKRARDGAWVWSMK